MSLRERNKKQRHGERGSTLYLVAGSMVILLGMGALAIDLASLYVARNESQRAADSAALAGAKVFVESGCVTTGDCSSEESTAKDRATQVAKQNLVGGKPVPDPVITFEDTERNPQITVQVQSAKLSIYFARAIGVKAAPTVSATATAEAYNPSGPRGGPAFCTSCVRPWLIDNCSPSFTTGCLLNAGNSYSVMNPNCVTAGGVVGQPIQIAIETIPKHFAAIDNDTGLAVYKKSITTCNTGQVACGTSVNTLPDYTPGQKIPFTTSGVDTLLHIGAGTTGLGAGQDWIDATSCPLKIRAGALNPLVNKGVLAADALVATSDSIVTAYIFDGEAPLPTKKSTPVTIKGFAQIFITQVDGMGDVWGVILDVAGCGSGADGSCGSGSIQGPTMLPVRLIQGKAD
jgi:hypothetical protein